MVRAPSACHSSSCRPSPMQMQIQLAERGQEAVRVLRPSDLVVLVRRRAAGTSGTVRSGSTPEKQPVAVVVQLGPQPLGHDGDALGRTGAAPGRRTPAADRVRAEQRVRIVMRTGQQPAAVRLRQRRGGPDPVAAGPCAARAARACGTAPAGAAPFAGVGGPVRRGRRGRGCRRPAASGAASCRAGGRAAGRRRRVAGPPSPRCRSVAPGARRGVGSAWAGRRGRAALEGPPRGGARARLGRVGGWVRAADRAVRRGRSTPGAVSVRRRGRPDRSVRRVAAPAAGSPPSGRAASRAGAGPRTGPRRPPCPSRTRAAAPASVARVGPPTSAYPAQ